MAVSFPQLLAQTLPPGTLSPSQTAGLSSTTLQSQTTFSSALNAALNTATPTAAAAAATASTTVPTPVVTPLTTTAIPGTTTVVNPLDNALTTVVTSLLAGNADQNTLTTLAQAGTTTATNAAAAQQATATTAANTTANATSTAAAEVAATAAERAASRIQQIRFQFSEAGQLTAPAAAVQVPVPASAPTSTPETQTTNSTSTTPTTPANAVVLPNLAATPADATRVAAQVQAPVLTTQANPAQALTPAIIPIGSGLERPPVDAMTETSAAQPVASGNRPGASSDRLVAAQLATEQLPTQSPPAPKGFATVLASATGTTLPSTPVATNLNPAPAPSVSGSITPPVPATTAPASAAITPVAITPTAITPPAPAPTPTSPTPTAPAPTAPAPIPAASTPVASTPQVPASTPAVRTTSTTPVAQPTTTPTSATTLLPQAIAPTPLTPTVASTPAPLPTGVKIAPSNLIPTATSPSAASATLAATVLTASNAVTAGSAKVVVGPQVEIAKADDSKADSATSGQTSAFQQTLANANAPTAAEKTAAAPRSESPSVADQVAQSVVSQVQVMNRPGNVEYSIRLDPANLGHVQIQIVSNGSNMSAHVTVANDAVRQMMESQLPELRQKLEQAGVTAPQIDVSTSTSGQQAGQNQNGASRWQDSQADYPFFRPSETPVPVRTRTLSAAGGSGSLLDVTV